MEEKKRPRTDELQKNINDLISSINSKQSDEISKMLKETQPPKESTLSELQIQLQLFKEETERQEREHWEKFKPKVVQQNPTEKKLKVSKDFTPFGMVLLIIALISVGTLILYTLLKNEYILYGATILFSAAFIVYKITNRR